jgi:integrase
MTDTTKGGATTAPPKRGGRPRKGSLEMRSGTWRARITLDDGSRRWFNLETSDRNAARRKLRQLTEQQRAGALPEPEKVREPETVDTYATSWLDGRAARGLPSASNERRYYEHVWKPAIGRMLITKVSGGVIQSVINDAAEGTLVGLRGEPYSRQSILHLRAMALRLFEQAWREGVISENPAKRTQVPEMDEESKPRAVLTDAEIGLLVSHPDVDPEIKLLTILSRTIGGLRTGDLNRLEWPAFSPNFETCTFVRRKTRKKRKGQTALVVPEPVRPFLATWWRAAGCPTEGVVFPARRGARAGQPKLQAKQSYAPRLRRALRIAFGLLARDPETGAWKDADRPMTPRETELLVGSTTVQAVDFHSTRRAYATALALAGVNEQTAMALTGHADSKVHRLYLEATTARALPDGAVPTINPEAITVFAANQNRPKRGAKPKTAKSESSDFFGAGEGIRTLDVHLGNSNVGVEASTKDAVSSGEPESGRPPETSVNRSFAPQGGDETPKCHPAEVALGVLLRARADELVNSLGGSA